MKSNFYLTIIFVFASSFGIAQDANIVFLHHSTGGLIYNDGHVADSIKAYNKANGTNFLITEKNFPDKPYPWSNYPYDYWNIWIDGYCEEQSSTTNHPNVACLDDLCIDYDVIILKHCFPGADILEDTGTPDITSSRKSFENFKLQYRALRDKFDSFPNNDFIIWTLVPKHRLAANSPVNAPRAKQFVDWVKDEWLSEDGKEHNNIHIFDYFSLTAELDTKVKAPRVPYCLKYKYERSHDKPDSHPNKLASEEVGPEFYRFIVNTLQKKSKNNSVNSQRYLEHLFDSVAVKKDILFKKVQDYKGSQEQLHLDVYHPHGDIENSRTAILWVHGGGFRHGTKEQNYIVKLATDFAMRGYVCISVNYRLREKPEDSMEATISDATEDLMNALSWVKANNKKTGVNCSSLIVAGGSAGGMIATNLCYKDATAEKDWDKDGIIALVNLWGSPGSDRMYQIIDKKDPPTIFVHGTADTIVPFTNCLWLSNELKNTGVRNEVFSIDGAGHTPVMYMNDIVAKISNFLYTIQQY